MIFSQNLFRRPTPTVSVEIGNQFLFVGPTPNLHYRKLTFVSFFLLHTRTLS